MIIKKVETAIDEYSPSKLREYSENIVGVVADVSRKKEMLTYFEFKLS